MKILEAGRFFVESIDKKSERADYLYVKNQAIGKGIW